MLYGTTFEAAAAAGCDQVLWLYGNHEEITEVGAMNIFIVLRNDKGLVELVTPPLSSGVILPGVTRRSVLVRSSQSFLPVFWFPPSFPVSFNFSSFFPVFPFPAYFPLFRFTSHFSSF